MSKNNMKLIMEGWRQSIKEMNAASAGGVQGHAGKDEQLNEDDYEDSGEPWNPKSSSYPFQHPQKGLMLRTSNRANFNTWAEKWKKENPDGQLTKAVRVAPKGEPGNAIKRMTPIMKRGMREEELDEGMKDMFIAALMALGIPSVASAGGIDHPYNPDMQHSQEIVQDAAQILANAAKKGDPDMKAAADALQKVADSPEDVQDSAAKFGLSDQAIEFADYALKKVSEKHSQSGAQPAADIGIEGDTNNDGKLSPLELQKLQQSKSNLTQKQKDDAKAGMKKIQQQKTNESAI